MWLTFILSVINVGISSFGTYILRLPGFDLTPVGMVMIARGGESTVWGAIILTFSYMIPRPGRFAFIWLQVPVSILVGYLAVTFDMIIIPILVFHAISVSVGLVLGMFRGRYLMYTIINLGLNLAIARMYGFVV